VIDKQSEKSGLTQGGGALKMNGKIGGFDESDIEDDQSVQQ
jgi:hypothetical protein